MASPRVLAVLLTLIAAGCQAEKSASTVEKASDAAKAKASEAIPVTLGLNWYPEAEHGGYYAALVHGFFLEEGLNVTIQEGGPAVPVIADVAVGKYAFGVDNADKLLLLRAQQADVVAVMSPIQNSPRCIMVHKKSGMNTLEDLAKMKEFTLAINQGQPFAQFLMKRMKLDHVRIVPFPSGVAGFLQEENYGQQAYSFSEPFMAEAQGGDPQCLMLTDINFNNYTSVLFTRREAIEQQSDLVAKMTRASIRGWKKYLSEPEETNKYIHSLRPEMGFDILAYGVKQLQALCLPEGFEDFKFGEMSEERWQTLITQMVEIESIKTDSVKASDAYTLKYLGAHGTPRP